MAVTGPYTDTTITKETARARASRIPGMLNFHDSTVVRDSGNRGFLRCEVAHLVRVLGFDFSKGGHILA